MYTHTHVNNLKGVGLSVIGLTGPPTCQKNRIEQVTCPLKPSWKIVMPWYIVYQFKQLAHPDSNLSRMAHKCFFLLSGKNVHYTTSVRDANLNE